MKLHLPKMLLTAVLAACIAPAMGTETTADLLTSSKGWSFNGFSYDPTAKTITKSRVEWGDAKTALYNSGRYGYTVGDDNTFEFAFTFSSAETSSASAATASNTILYFLLSGDDDNVTIGGDKYGATTMGYGTSIPTDYNSTVLTPFTSEEDTSAPRVWGKEYEVNGTVSYTDNKYTLTMTMTLDGTTYSSSAIDLGTSFVFSDFGMYGISGVDTLKSLTVTGNQIYNGYEATISGDTAIADVAWSRRGNTYATADINMTNGSSYLNLKGSGEGAAVTFAEGTNVGGIDVTQGNVTLKGSGSITSSELVVNNNATAIIGNGTTFITSAGGISVETGSSIQLATNAALDLTGTTLGNRVDGKRIDQILDYLNTNIDTADGAYIKLALGNTTGTGTGSSVADNQELRLGTRGSDMTLNQNFEFTTKLFIHGNDSATAGRALAINEGATLKLNEQGEVVSKAILNINGGNVIAQKGLALGHSTSSNGSYWGKLTMSSGSIKTGTISFRTIQTGNAIDIDGGYLEFTATDAITYATGNSATQTAAISIDNATLKATTVDWTLDGKSASNATISGVTIDAANTKDITLKNVTLGGDITNNNDLILGSGVTVATGVTFKGSGTTTLASLLTNNGSISGTLKINSLEGFTHTDEGYSQGINAGNGILSVNYVVIGGTNKEGIQISYGDKTYTTTADGQIKAGDDTIFQITNTTAGEKVSTINAISSVTQIKMGNGTSLIVDANTSDTITVASGESATLELNSTSTGALAASSFSADGATINVTKNAASASSELSLGNTDHTIGSLVIGDGVTVSSTYKDGDARNGKGFIKDSLTINAGGAFKHSGSALSPFGQGTGKLGSITMGGGTKTATMLLTNRSAIDGTTLTLSGNTLIGSAAAKGAVTDAKESPDDNRDKFAILDFVNNNEVSVSGTGNVVDAALRLRGGNTTFNVKKTESVTGELTINGNIFKANDTNGKFLKKGDGKLTIGAASSEIATVEVYSGTMEFDGGAHSYGTLDMSCSGNVGVGTVTLKDKAVLTASTLWLRSAATLNIEEGATLKLGTDGIVNIKGTAGSTTGDTTSGTTVSVANTSGKKYLMTGSDNGSNSSDYTISNAEVSVDTTSEARTISNILSNSKLVNGGVNKLTADNASSTYSAIDATKGSIDILNAQEQTLSALTVGAGMAVGVYSGNSVPTKPTTADEATITVDSLTAGAGATLNANLVLSNDATVTLANALTMGSTLTLGEGMKLSGDLVSTIKSMSDDGTVDLFTGVDALYLGDSTTASAALDATSGVNLDTYFDFEGASKYYLGYSGGNVFAGVMPIPEPTTATLSLLALAGLAARRRRK